MDSSTVAFIVSGLVAIAGLLVPAVTTAINEREKWSREKRAAAEEKLGTATAEVIDPLATFRSSVGSSAQDSTARYTQLLGKYYRWRYILWPYLSADDRSRVEQIHRTLQAASGRTENLRNNSPELATEILALTDIDRVKVK